MLGLKLNHVSKRGHRTVLIFDTPLLLLNPRTQDVTITWHEAGLPYKIEQLLIDIRRVFILHWEKSYHGPALYSLHSDDMTDFGLLTAVSWLDVKYTWPDFIFKWSWEVPNKLVLHGLLNRDILYGMLKTYWKPLVLKNVFWKWFLVLNINFI